MVVGGLIFKRFGVRIAAAVGCTIFSGSVFLSYFAIQKSFIAFVATYGVMYGLGTFSTYAAPLTSAVKWLPNHPGLAGGFIIAGFGGGASIFNQVITQYINPHNKAPDDIEGTDRYFSDADLLDREPTCFLILGAIYSGMQIIGIIMITSPPTESYGQTFIQDDHFLAIVGSCSSIFNCIGRICWGAFMDRFTFKITLQCVTAIFASFVATIIASEWGGEPFFFVWVCALYMSFSGMYAALPASLSNLYGADNIGINYGLVSSVTIFSGLGTALLGSSFKGLMGWHGIFLLSSGIVAIGFIASFFFNDRQVKRR